MAITFTPVSRMCLYCRERIFITESVDEVTCPKCGKVMRVVIGTKLRLSRIPVAQKTEGELNVNSSRKKRT